MAFQRDMLSSKTYTEEDHRTWAALYARQSSMVSDYACQLFLEGLPRLKLDTERVPSAEEVTSLLQRMSGWTLGEGHNEHGNATTWFEHIADYRFPVNNYLRPYESLAFTPLSDLFHEYYGHLPFFADLHFADTAQMFGPLYLVANERQRQEISRLWWYTIEVGLIEEAGHLKAFGARLLSSPGELQHALRPATSKEPFDIERVIKMPSAPNGYHSTYFILDDVGQIRRMLQDYARMKCLPVPQTAL